MNIMASWGTLDKLEGEKTIRDFIDSSVMKETKQFTYHKPFGIHFRYIHQVDDHNNCRHAEIYLERTWVTKLYPDPNLGWYLAVSEANKSPAPGHFQNDGVVQPSLDFWRDLARECLENKIGFEFWGECTTRENF